MKQDFSFRIYRHRLNDYLKTRGFTLREKGNQILYEVYRRNSPPASQVKRLQVFDKASFPFAYITENRAKKKRKEEEEEEENLQTF